MKTFDCNICNGLVEKGETVEFCPHISKSTKDLIARRWGYKGHDDFMASLTKT